MAFLSGFSNFEDIPKSFVINDRSDSTVPYPTTAELSKAVSVSLGLDMNSPNTIMNLGSSSSVHSVFDNTVENRSRCETESIRHVRLEGVILLRGTDQKEDDFGEVCQDTQQVSCMDLLRSSEMDGAQTMTRTPGTSRFVCKETSLFTNPVGQMPAPCQADDLATLKPYSVFANPTLSRDNALAWHAYSGQPEPDRHGLEGHYLLCKYCSYGQTSNGSRQKCHCDWYNNEEQGRNDGIRAATAQEYGQVESYQSVVSQGHTTFTAIKTEPEVWMDWMDHSFR